MSKEHSGISLMLYCLSIFIGSGGWGFPGDLDNLPQAGASSLILADARVPGKPSPGAPRKLLFIGIDGCRPDALIAAHTPHIDSVIATGAVNYDAQIKEGQITVSGPGWSSMLTGVWADKHQVFDNDFASPNLEQYPVFFQRLREVHPDVYIVSVVNWKPINQSIIDGADEELYGNDEQVGQLAAEALSNPNLDVLFAAFDEVDGAGHKYTYGPAVKDYLSQIEKTDESIGKILQALHARPTYQDENWLILITTDHGGIDKGHGGNTPEEKTIFLIVSGPDSLKGEISPAPMLVDAGVTALTFLAGKVPCNWDLDGKVFGLDPKVFPAPPTCPRCPRNLSSEVKEQERNVYLDWTPAEGIVRGKYELLRDGEVIASLPIEENHYNDYPELSTPGISQTFVYTLRLLGTPPDLICEDLTCTADFISGLPFFTESFDGLGDSLSKAEFETKCVSVSGWSHTPPPGWTIDNSGMGASPGVPEWRGWTFATPAFWTCVEDQRRSGFTKGSGVIAIADPDEWADTDPPPAKGESFNSILISPPIDLPDGGETIIVFDSHYRQEGPQRAEFRVSINGGADQVLLRYSKSPEDDNTGRDVMDKRVCVRLPAQPPQSKVVLKWALLDGDNNWFWAIDNVALYHSKRKISEAK